MNTIVSAGEIGSRIYLIRGIEVMLDRDLANFYSVETKYLNRVVRRNIDRFPSDFMFEVGESENESLFQSRAFENRKGTQGKYLPLVFSEQGAMMLSTVLKSDRAAEMNIAIMRAFVEFRRTQRVLSNFMAKMEERMDEQTSILTNLSLQSELRSKELLREIQDLKSIITKNAKSKPYPIARNQSVNLELIHRQKVADICKAVANYYGLTVENLIAVSRSKWIALPRQVAFYLTRKMVNLGFKDIGMVFGGKDHTTVMHGCQKIDSAIAKKDSEIVQAVESIKRQLKEKA